MHDVTSFGLTILLVSGALSAALLASKLGARTSIPSAALFLVAASLASYLFPSLVLSISTVEKVATVALIVILFDGGSSIGWRRFRASALPIASLGVFGTFATAGLITVFAHWAFDLSWITSGLLGAAIAPTDPAVMFSVLGEREITGRTGTILEGESGANDPVGIALMLGMIELATHADASFWIVIRVFVEQMSIGLAIGIAGGLVERRVMQRVALPSAGLYTLRTLALAGLVFGVATVAHGSGFLAVFVAGLIVGDVRAPFSTEIHVFQDGLAALAEIVVFVALGLTIDLSALTAGRWVDGLLLAAFAAAGRPSAGGRRAARSGTSSSRRASVRHLGRPEGRSADPPGRVRARPARRRRAPHLRDGLRRRPRLGDRAGRDDRHRRSPPRRGKARTGIGAGGVTRRRGGRFA